MPERSFSLRAWLPLILQSLAFLGAGWGYAVAQEHRMTVTEESIKSQRETIQSMAATQQILATQVQSIEKTQAMLIALEEYVHKAR